MIVAQARRSPFQRPPQCGASRTLTVAAGAVILALSLATPAAWAQVVAPPGPSVTVHGTGEASVSAASASVQLLIGGGGRRFGFAEDASSSSGFETADESLLEEPMPVATPAANDGDQEVDVGESSAGRRDRGERAGRIIRAARSGPQPITAERLAPVVEAIATGAGLTPDAVTVDLSPMATEPFGGRERNARLDFEVAQPTPDALAAVIAAASDAAAANGLVIEVAGVRYNPADCAVVEQEAAAAAIVDAREQADRLAALLGVTLGDVVNASSDPYFGLRPQEGGCSGQGGFF